MGRGCGNENEGAETLMEGGAKARAEVAVKDGAGHGGVWCGRMC